jgi:hypothetical protein
VPKGGFRGLLAPRDSRQTAFCRGLTFLARRVKPSGLLPAMLLLKAFDELLPGIVSVHRNSSFTSQLS